MSFAHTQHVLAAFIAVTVCLLALWTAGGFAAAIAGAAFADIGLSIIERRRMRHAAPAQAQRDRG